MRLALLSDTHGLFRPELFPWLSTVDRIVHAGDVGSLELLIELEAFAPVSGVWGNTDGFELRHRLPEVARRSWEGYEITVLHGHQLGMPTPERLAELHPITDLLVYGHTHVPYVGRIGRTLVINPGSCGHRRGSTAPSIVLATLTPEGIDAELIQLADAEL